MKADAGGMHTGIEQVHSDRCEWALVLPADGLLRAAARVPLAAQHAQDVRAFVSGGARHASGLAVRDWERGRRVLDRRRQPLLVLPPQRRDDLRGSATAKNPLICKPIHLPKSASIF